VVRRHPSTLTASANILDSLPNLTKPLAKADPELRRRVYEAFHLSVELDRNTPQIRLKALLSSAFSAANDLDDFASMVANQAIAGGRYGPISDQQLAVEAVVIWPVSRSPQRKT
jgi:hypothetical protein